MRKIDKIIRSTQGKIKAKVLFTGGIYNQRTGQFMNWGYAYIRDPDSILPNYLPDRIFISPKDLSRLKLEGLRRLDDVLLYVKKDSKGRYYGADIELIKRN
ncbi:MAG: hypothetical protein GX923_04475 [Clostridia bacterium]|nr:hypothetical protein [Clostridia bacterium]